MEPTSRPAACSERIAVSRPDPGPLTNTSTLRRPCSWARFAAASAAIWAANGVDLREPLNPTSPAEAQEITAPFGSVMDTMVLLKVLLMCAWPSAIFFLSFLRGLRTAPRVFGGIISPTESYRGKVGAISSGRLSSCRRRYASGPCGYERWSSYADRVRAGPCGDAGLRSCRFQPCGGYLLLLRCEGH